VASLIFANMLVKAQQVRPNNVRTLLLSRFFVFELERADVLGDTEMQERRAIPPNPIKKYKL